MAKNAMMSLMRFVSRGGIGGLLLRSAGIALLWLFLPRWIFLAAALYFYFVPPFRSGSFFLPFVLFIIAAFAIPSGILSTLFLAASFFLIVGMKELLFVEREATYKMLVLLFMFAAFVSVFRMIPKSGSLWLWLWSVVAIAFFLLEQGALKYGYSIENERRTALIQRMQITFAYIAFFIWQGGIIVSFVPANFLYQTILLFVSVAVFIEIADAHIKNILTKERFFWYFAVFLTIFVVTLTTIPWGI